MGKTTSIAIIGRDIDLKLRGKSELKGITVGDSIEYTFYDGEYLGICLLFIKPRKKNPSPKVCSLTSLRLSSLFGRPVVFILSSGPSYERQRLIDKDVYFVMGDKFAHLPMLVANERFRRALPSKRLSPVAQYILLYHLQVESLEGLSAREMEGRLPYSYESITLGLSCLSDLGLGVKTPDGPKRKAIHFSAKGRELWDKAQVHLINPVEKRIYCDQLLSDLSYTACGINALSHYSMLNPDKERMIMMSKKQWKGLQSQKAIRNENMFDGNVMIEVWKYPVVSLKSSESEWVDKLSLVISLKSDTDARVESEVEKVINEMKWSD